MPRKPKHSPALEAEIPVVAQPAPKKPRGKKASSTSPETSSSAEIPTSQAKTVALHPEPALLPSEPSVPSVPSTPSSPSFVYLKGKYTNPSKPPEPTAQNPTLTAESSEQDSDTALLHYFKGNREIWNLRDLERVLPHTLKKQLGERKNLEHCLDDMVERKLLTRLKRRLYTLYKEELRIVGKYQASSSGAYGFVIPQGGGEDLFIAPEQSMGAFDGDTVVALNEGRRKGDNNPRGRIVEVSQRANSNVVGTFRRHQNFPMVIPDEHRIGKRIFLQPENTTDVEEGARIVVELRWESGNPEPYGVLLEVLGMGITPETETKAIIAEYNLRDEFPEPVVAETQKISNRISKKMLDGRQDLRDKNIFTVDGRDAKDFDDAIHIETLPEGGFVVGIHIADVSYYITENTDLDNEAYTRATSVYLPGQVLPMLPEKLSNGVCSLVPHKDRLTLSALVELDSGGNIQNYRLTPSVIHSKARLTYDQVQAYSEAQASLPEDARFLEGDMHLLLKITQKLRKRRMAEGSLDFKLSEVKVEVGKDGTLELIPIAEETARGMIEDLMLLANKVVAQYMLQHNIPALYRVHEDPAEDRWHELRLTLQRMGLEVQESPSPQTYQHVLKQVRGSSKEMAVNHLLLRSMKQAHYAAENLGHFGLAFDEYLHFTSPIRRYPDLVVHRMLREQLSGKLTPERKAQMAAYMDEAGKHTSERERAAASAERDLTKFYQCLWAKDHLGEVFAGTVSGVTSFGVFITLSGGVEGLIRLNDLPKDHYVFYEDAFVLEGKASGQRYQFGDTLNVQIANVNLISKQIDLVREGEEMENKVRVRKKDELEQPERKSQPALKTAPKPLRKRRVITLERTKPEHNRPVNVTVQKLYFGDWTGENLQEDEQSYRPRRPFQGRNQRPEQAKRSPKPASPKGGQIEMAAPRSKTPAGQISSPRRNTPHNKPTQGQNQGQNQGQRRRNNPKKS